MTRHGNLALTTTYYACSLYSPEVYKYTRHVLVLVVGALFMYYIQRWYSLEYYTHTAFGFYPITYTAGLVTALISRARVLRVRVRLGLTGGLALARTHSFTHVCIHYTQATHCAA